MSCRTHRKRRSNDSHLDGYREIPGRIHRPSPTSLTRATMDAVAENRPKARLTRAERDQVNKVIMWPFVGSFLPPRVGLRELKQYQALTRREQVAA